MIMKKLLREESEVLLLHLFFALLCAAVLPVPGVAMGVKLFILVAAYNIAVPLAGTLRGHASWRDVWLFALILSLFQVVPDWFLSDVLGVLVFPEDGFPKIGTVSGYMAGLWAIPVFIIVYAGTRVRERRSPGAGYLAAAILSLAIFGASEATVWMLPSWYARGVLMAGPVAVYIIIPEVILGIACLHAYVTTRGAGIPVKAFAAFIVMQLYLGSAAFFYFLIERVIR